MFQTANVNKHSEANVHGYLYHTRYAGEGRELVGSSFTSCWSHQTKEGGLQEATGYVLYCACLCLNMVRKGRKSDPDRGTNHADVPYPQRGNRLEQHEHLLISWHRSPHLWPPLIWRAPEAELCIWLAWPWANPDGTQWLKETKLHFKGLRVIKVRV